jgi:hypothetical protein
MRWQPPIDGLAAVRLRDFAAGAEREGGRGLRDEASAAWEMSRGFASHEAMVS